MLDASRDAVAFWSPSSRSSSTPVTVNVWATFQLAGVNVIATPGWISEASWPVIEMATSAVGLASRTTDRSNVEPASDTSMAVVR